MAQRLFGSVAGGPTPCRAHRCGAPTGLSGRSRPLASVRPPHRSCGGLGPGTLEETEGAGAAGMVFRRETSALSRWWAVRLGTAAGPSLLKRGSSDEDSALKPRAVLLARPRAAVLRQRSRRIWLGTAAATARSRGPGSGLPGPGELVRRQGQRRNDCGECSLWPGRQRRVRTAAAWSPIATPG